ncbi:MAG: hypothetical protein U0984_02285 [Prosthecobacter sp.]|nr:hypothetical protein [Prosthecobacter sp.]
MIKFIAICSLLTITACHRGNAPQTSVNEITGSNSERVLAISAIIGKHKVLPTGLGNAYFVEEKIGDGILGPSDFRTFYLLEIAPWDSGQWLKILTPMAEVPKYALPVRPCHWWLAESEFHSLQFYQSDTLTGRIHGWIGVSPKTGRIYIFTYTM